MDTIINKKHCFITLVCSTRVKLIVLINHYKMQGFTDRTVTKLYHFAFPESVVKPGIPGKAFIIGSALIAISFFEGRKEGVRNRDRRLNRDPRLNRFSGNKQKK